MGGWPSEEQHHEDYARAVNGEGDWPGDKILCVDGAVLPGDAMMVRSRAYIRRIGKRAAGRLLDGREWSEALNCHDVPYAPGDRLWVRETWQALCAFDHLKPSDIPAGSDILYTADRPGTPWDSRRRLGMFMPR